MPASMRDSLLRAAPLVLVTLLVGFWVEHSPNTAGDTPGLVSGARAAADCIEVGNFIDCGTSPRELAEQGTTFEDAKTSVAPFPILQYLPAVPLHLVGMSVQNIYETLALISLAAFLGMLAVLLHATRRLGQAAWGYGLVLVVLASPLLFYANNTFGEMLAAFFTVLFVAALVLRVDPLPLAVAAFLAGITKETAAPFLAAIALIAFLAPRRDDEPLRPRLIGAAAGIAAAVVVNAAFNVFRYGSPINEDYTIDAFTVPTAELSAEWFAGGLVSPNAGLVFWWPLALLLMLAVVLAGIRVWRRSGDWRRAWPALALFAVFIGLQVGFARWWGPYGWWAWGPRLILPWLPALGLLAVALYGAELAAMARGLLRRPAALVATAAVITLFAAPHMGAMLRPLLMEEAFVVGGACTADMYPGDDAYYDCLHEQTWERYMPLARGLEELDTPYGYLLVGVFFAGACGLLVRMRESPPFGGPTNAPVAQRAPLHRTLAEA